MTFNSSNCVSQSNPDEYRVLIREFAYALKVYEADLKDAEYGRIFVENRRPAKIYRFMELVHDEQANNPELVDPLVWVSKVSATWGSKGPLMSTVGDRARRLLIRHHIGHRSIGLALSGMLFLDAGSQAAESLLREAIAKSKHRDVQGRACYWLAMYLKNQAECIPELKQPSGAFNLREWFEKRWGTEAIARLREADVRKLLAEAEELFSRAVAHYPDVATFGWTRDDEPLASSASKELHELRDLAIGRMAPEIVGHDVEGNEFKLSEYRGRVVLLTFSANWCGHCVAMYPQERELLDHFDGQPFVILSVNTDQERAELRRSLHEGQITWRCWWDGPARSICREWNVSAFPTIYVIDSAGVIRHKNLRGRALDEAVESLVLEQTRQNADTK